MKRTAMQHTKLKRLVRVLQVPQYAAVGILESLWHLTAREAPMGNIGKLSNEDIAAWIDWTGDADALMAGLVSSGWVDGSETDRLVVHDWFEHADDATKLAIKRKSTTVSGSVGQTPTTWDKTPLPEPLPVPVPEPNKKQKPSRSREGDPRHDGFKAAIMAYGAYKGVKLSWDGSEAKQLKLLLDSAPDLTLKEFQACLNHRARSPGTPHGERPRLWLPNILRYQQGPLNSFNRTEEAHGNQGKSAVIAQTANDALGILRAGRMAASENFDSGADHAGAGAGRDRQGQDDRVVEGHFD